MPQWSSIVERLREGGWFWLTTVRPDATPHVMPLFAAWSQSCFYIASRGDARKSRNLDRNPACVLTRDLGDIHLIIEGQATRLQRTEDLERSVDAFREVYDWPTSVAADQIDAEYSAPTSGGPPFNVYSIAPRTVYALPTDDNIAPTRWRFAGL